MKIIFVRHGHPNYNEDCLTELGHPQAGAAAERLSTEKIDKIFSSTCGRAVETAQHIAARHDLDITQFDFMREIRWGVPNTDDFVHPWSLVDEWVKNGKDIMSLDWKNDPDYKGHQVVESYNNLAICFDELLETLGFKREGCYYRVIKENNATIDMPIGRSDKDRKKMAVRKDGKNAITHLSYSILNLFENCAILYFVSL